MNKREIIYTIGENRITLGQNSKGIWTCNELSLNCKTLAGGLRTVRPVAFNVKALLEELNSSNEPQITMKVNGGEDKTVAPPKPVKVKRAHPLKRLG